MGGSIWSIDPSTGVATELTRGAKYHSSPTWSPDGRWIIYTADDGGNTIQLEILDVTTGDSHALTDDEFVYVDPEFSPDGSQVAYVSTAPNGYFNVYIRSIREGGWSGDEVAVSSDNNFGRSRLYFGDQDMHINPTWLPSGDELLMVSNRDVALGSGNVIRVPAAANGMARRQTVLAEQTLYRARPDVSIDGRRFIYSSTSGTADQFNNLYVQPTVGGRALQDDLLPARRLPSPLVPGRRNGSRSSLTREGYLSSSSWKRMAVPAAASTSRSAYT